MKPKRQAPHQRATPSFGTWLSVGSPVVAELAAESGFDWLLFDLEHGCGSEASLFGNLQAIKGTNAAGIVRVGAPHPDLIMRALDWGADGIMVPHVSSVTEAEACVRAVHYPPRGRRGISRTVRAYKYGLRQEARPPEPRLLVQIETLQAVQNVREIAHANGVDVLFVGPGDLNFDIKARGRKAGLSYEDCLANVLAGAKEARKQAGILVRNIEELPRLIKMGFTHIAVDSDLSILRTGYQESLTRAGAAGTKAGKTGKR